jgi:arsenical pump membrane protein
VVAGAAEPVLELAAPVIGSLAGLLWIDLLRRSGVEVGVARFIRLGTLVLLPTLAASLALLWLLRP